MRRLTAPRERPVGPKVAQRGRPLPEALAEELKAVLNVGSRASKVAAVLSGLPLLRELAGGDNGAAGDPYQRAGVITRMITVALRELGDGPYGGAACALLGVAPATRGLTLPARRRAAAAILDIEPATLVRHWERVILLDVAIALTYPEMDAPVRETAMPSDS